MVKRNRALQNASPQGIEIAETPLKFCTVSLSEVISRGKRLEASVFDVDARQARSIIEHCIYSTTRVGGMYGLADSYVCGRFKRIWVSKSDLPIFQPSSITDVHPNPDGYISHKTQTNIEALRVHTGQILMTCSGSIGKVAYVSRTLDNKIFSHDLLRINCKNPIDAGYVYAYLKTSIGNKILLTNSYGAVITHIEPEHLAAIPIPDAPEDIKKRINDLIVQSYELRDESNDLIDEATSLLVKELHLPDIHEFETNLYKKDAGVKTFNVKLSHLSGRLDASYHVPIVDAIVNHIKQYAAEVTTVGDSRVSKDVILAGVFKRVYVNEGYGYRFLGGKDITQLAPQTEKYLSKAVHKARYEKELKVSENYILVTDRGTIGVVSMVPKHWDGCAVSQNVLKLIPASLDIAGYLYTFLNTHIGKLLIQHETYGSVIDMIDNNSLKKIPVPLLCNQKSQQHINDLAMKANEKRYEAYMKEQKALRIIDEEVIFAK